jgi:hypothetical protein
MQGVNSICRVSFSIILKKKKKKERKKANNDKNSIWPGKKKAYSNDIWLI